MNKNDRQKRGRKGAGKGAGKKGKMDRKYEQIMNKYLYL